MRREVRSLPHRRLGESEAATRVQRLLRQKPQRKQWPLKDRILCVLQTELRLKRAGRMRGNVVRLVELQEERLDM